MRVLAGTSGFSYKEWKGSFYPEDLSADAMLSFYAERLPAVEINNTFYRMPKPAAAARAGRRRCRRRSASCSRPRSGSRTTSG